MATSAAAIWLSDREHGVDGLHLPALGIYAVLVDVLTGPERGSYKGVASLGARADVRRQAPQSGSAYL